eukprot:scaffold16.g77.t1
MATLVGLGRFLSAEAEHSVTSTAKKKSKRPLVVAPPSVSPVTASAPATATSGTPPALQVLEKPRSRCAQPGHRKAQREGNDRLLTKLGERLGAGASSAVAPPPRASAFAAAANSDYFLFFLEVDPDEQEAVLVKMKQHNKELRHSARGTAGGKGTR